MYMVTCDLCGLEWDNEKYPMCPRCISNQWSSMDEGAFVYPKHDIREMPNIEPKFRSVLNIPTLEMMQNLLFLVATNGSPLMNTRHGKPAYIYIMPDGTSGCTVRRNSSELESPCEGIVIADPFVHPHIYPEESAVLIKQKRDGTYIPLPKCSEPNCNSISCPPSKKCFIHKKRKKG